MGTTSPSPGAPGSSTTFATIQSEVFDQLCTTASCHSATNRAGGLTLEAGESYDNLVGVDPENSVAKAAGLKRVVPGSEEESFLLKKLSADLVAGEGSPMPFGTGGLTTTDAAKFELVREWVLAGAPRDPPASAEPEPAPM